jgi:hypothetical protein
MKGFHKGAEPVSVTIGRRGSTIAEVAVQGAEARLKLARQMLALAQEQGAPPETIMFWEEAVADHEAELARHQPVEKQP